MTADITALDTPLQQVEADVRRLTLVAAEARTHSPSDRIAWRLDEYLVTHPDAPLSTEADYPGWMPGAVCATAPTEPTWKPIPGYEGNYEVSDQGEVRSRPRPRTKGGPLKAKAGKVGYPKVSLCVGGRPETHFVHWLVAAAFLGPRPKGYDIRHLDGNPLNCTLSNLAYGTRSENELDKRRHRALRNAEGDPAAKADTEAPHPNWMPGGAA